MTRPEIIAAMKKAQDTFSWAAKTNEEAEAAKVEYQRLSALLDTLPLDPGAATINTSSLTVQGRRGRDGNCGY